MKTILVAWLLMIAMSDARSTILLSSFAVHVRNGEGEFIQGATVEFEGNRIEAMLKFEKNKTSPFAKALKLASEERKTDALGATLVYFVSGPSPITVRGTIVVSAPGYKTAKIPVDRVYHLEINGNTGLMLTVGVKLEEAEQAAAPNPGDG